MVVPVARLSCGSPLSWWQSKIFWFACGAAEAVTGLARLTVPPWDSRYIRYKIVFVIKIVTPVTLVTLRRITAPGIIEVFGHVAFGH